MPPVKCLIWSTSHQQAGMLLDATKNDGSVVIDGWTLLWFLENDRLHPTHMLPMQKAGTLSSSNGPRVVWAPFYNHLLLGPAFFLHVGLSRAKDVYLLMLLTRVVPPSPGSLCCCSFFTDAIPFHVSVLYSCLE